jgi:hypothetical protein
MTYHAIPRVHCDHPLGLDIPPGQPIPVRARDDLDPTAPPLEYADGRISWSGYTSREERDSGRIIEAERAAAEGQRRSAEAATRAAELARADRERRRNLAYGAARDCVGHTADKTSEPRCFTGPVAGGFSIGSGDPSEYNPAAHGNIEVTETCRCGAERRVLINQLHHEYGPWYVPEVE